MPHGSFENSQLKKLLLVDDDKNFLDSLSVSLRTRVSVTSVCTRAEFLKAFDHEKFDIIVTDYKLGDWDGFDVIQHVKQSTPQLPIIVVSGFVDKTMAVRCANLHVHRILEKPIPMAEFYTAIEEAFSNTKLPHVTTYSYGPMILMSDSFSVRLEGERVQLTETEFYILCLLVQNTEKCVDRDEFHKMLWGKTKVSPNVLDTHLLNIKKKIPLLKGRLKNIRGHGYFLPNYQA